MNKLICRSMTVLTAILFSALSPAALAQPYAVNVFSDDQLGELVLSGDSQVVVETVTNLKRRLRINDHLHVCAAYLKLGDAQRAAMHCETAERRARNKMRTDSVGGSPATLQYAMAATNMGVLHALEGNTSDARKIFRRALRAKPWHDSAVRNLEILDSRSAALLADQPPVDR